jgi:hypothetical protein
MPGRHPSAGTYTVAETSDPDDHHLREETEYAC